MRGSNSKPLFQSLVCAIQASKYWLQISSSFQEATLHYAQTRAAAKTMSGFEIAGVVLGSIPLVVSALEYYMKGASAIDSFRSYKRVLKSLIRILEAEHAILQDVCEKLLVGIAPQTSIEAMIDDPFGALWKEGEVSRKLQLRLWRSFKIFDSTVKDMREAVQDLMEKLGIGTDGKVQWTENTSLKRQFKKAAFILQRSNHEEALGRIRDGVSSLQKLACLNVELEPERKLRSQGRLNRLVRDVSGSVYRALRSTIACKCPGLHDVGLRLAPPSRTIVPDDDDDDVAKELQFRFVISQNDSSASTTLWKNLVLQIANEETAAALSAPTKPRPRGVQFATQCHSSSASQTVTLTTQRSAMLETAIASLTLTGSISSKTPRVDHDIDDLCEFMQQAMGGIGHCGNVKDGAPQKTRQYSVYTLADLRDWELVPLINVLSNLRYGDKLRLSWIIACSVLQMYGTPWMSASPTHNSIYIAQSAGKPQYQNVFILKSLPEQSHPNDSTMSGHPAFMSLGILLIELILGQSMEVLQGNQTHQHTSGASQIMSEYEAAHRLLGRVEMIAGSGYHGAVQRCLRSDFVPADGQSEAASHRLGELFSDIVGPLERDLKTLI